MKINKLLAVYLSLAALGATLSPARASSASKYTPLELVSGVRPKLELQLHKKGLHLNLRKTENLRLKVNVSHLFTTNESTASFKIAMYEIVNGVREFVTSQSLSIQRGATKTRILSMNAGHFNGPTKEVEFDLFDTQNNLINTYRTTLTATHVDSQATSGSGVDLDAVCAGDNFGECQLDAFFNRVNFVVRRQRQASTRVIKDQNGIYKVTIPVPRRGYHFLRGNRYRAFNVATGTGGNGTATIPEFVDSLGVGVNSKSALLEVGAGNGLVPSLIINPGPLTSTVPANGAIEFDGNNLFLTKNGARSVLGAQGPAGSQGATGATGPQGPVGATGATGPQGPAGALTGGTVNGNLAINGGLTVTGTVTAASFVGPTPFSVAASAVDVNGVTTVNVASLNYVKLIDSNPLTVDEIFTLTGGITGQRVTLHLQNNINFRADNIGSLNAIQWGRGTSANTTRFQFATEAFEFFYDGNSWFLLDRYTL